MTFGLLVHQHHSFLDLAELTEVSLHLIDGCVLRHAADENLLRLVRRLRAVLWRCMLRINLLSVQRVNRNFQNFLDGIWFLVVNNKSIQSGRLMDRKKG